MSRNDPKTTTAESIAASLLGEEFARFIAGAPFAVERTDIGVAVLPEVDARFLRLAAGVRVVRLSTETAAAKLAKHKNTAAEWRELQWILDNATRKFYRPRYTLIYFCRWQQKYRAAVVKRTHDGRELFVTTMHWAKERDIARAVRNNLLMEI